MDDFLFLRPYWLLALIPALVILYLGWRSRSTEDTPWSRVIDAHLLRHLIAQDEGPVNRWPLMLLGLGWLIGVLSLAGPSWQRLPPVTYEPDVPPLVIALDLSRSMNTRDIHPTRLEAGRAKLRQLLGHLSQRPVALVVYSSMAHRVLPFTNDRQLILDTLEFLSPGMMPAQGSRATSALDLAYDLFASYDTKDADLLLVTDGVDDDAQRRASQLADEGIRVSVLGVGTTDGGYVPDSETGYLLASTGPVTTALEPDRLQRLAESGDGRFQQAVADNADIAALLEGFGKPAGTGSSASDPSEIPHDSGPLLIALIIPIALLMFRQGGGILALVAVVVLTPNPAEATSWDKLWLNTDQRARQALDQQQPERAAILFRDPLWRGIAAYRSADYAAAAAAFAQAPGAIAHYNRGNALARLGRLSEAMDAYHEALAINPKLEDATQNLAVVQKALEDTKVETKPIELENVSKEIPKPEPKGESRIADSAEELLDGPRKEDFEQPRGDTERGLGGIGSAGGGAMMVEGADRPETDEGTTIGQGMTEGEQDWESDDRVARQGGTANREDANKNATREIVPGHTPPGGDDEQQRSAHESPRPTGRPLDAVAQSPDDETPKDDDSEPTDTFDGNRDLYSDDASQESTNKGIAGQSTHQEMLRIWIDGIEDDPSGLLREKFRREHRRNTERFSVEKPW